MWWYVYVLKCEDGGYYIGCTKNLEERIKRHENGKVKATKDRLPVQLTTCISFDDKYKAYSFEKYLKSGSGRAFSRRHF